MPVHVCSGVYYYYSIIACTSMWWHRTYSTTALLTPVYSAGFCTAVCMVVQVCTGLILASDYSAADAFGACAVHLRDLDGGWITRSVHAVGASLFMLCVYVHLGRCLWYTSSGTRGAVWMLGVVMYLLLAGACFTGYSLVNGQMSLWAIVVISNLAGALLGDGVLDYLWGGSIVGVPTLQRFYVAHYLLPLVIVAVSVAHLLLLHAVGSTGDEGVLVSRSSLVNLVPVMLVRDLAVYSLLGAFGAYVLGWYPEVFGHPDNWEHGDPLVTPALIAPEWYLLPCYGVLRAVPSKTLGVLAMAAALVLLLPLLGVVIKRVWLVIASSRWYLAVVLLDACACAYLCLECNTIDTLYGLLVACMVSWCCSQVLPVVRSSLPVGRCVAGVVVNRSVQDHTAYTSVVGSVVSSGNASVVLSLLAVQPSSSRS